MPSLLCRLYFYKKRHENKRGIIWEEEGDQRYGGRVQKRAIRIQSRYIIYVYENIKTKPCTINVSLVKLWKQEIGTLPPETIRLQHASTSYQTETRVLLVGNCQDFRSRGETGRRNRLRPDLGATEEPPWSLYLSLQGAGSPKNG